MINFKKLIAVIIYCDGEIANEEIEKLNSLSKEMGITDLVETVNAEIQILEKFDEGELRDYIKQAAEGITDEETQYKVFDTLMDFSLSDNCLDDYEILTLALMAKHLNIPTHYFAGNLAYKVKTLNTELNIQTKWEDNNLIN